jgi:hypothetical protein
MLKIVWMEEVIIAEVARPRMVDPCFLERGKMLRITRLSNGQVVLKLSGRMTSENLPELEALFNSEKTDCNVAMDLKDLTIVDRDAVSFLQSREADGVELKNCPTYIREWIRRERG